MIAPLVTVVMPVHNGKAYIGAAIDSVLGQTLSNLECVVVDDGSTDGTPEVLRGYQDPRLKLLRNEECIGVSASRNRGLAAAAAPYVAFLDADDVAYPNRLETQLEYLELHPDIVVVGCHLDYIDSSGAPLFSERPCQRPCEPEALRVELLNRACILPSAAMGRKRALLDAGGFHAMDYAEDHDLWCRLAVDHDLAILPDRLIAYRQHPEQATFKKILTGYQGTRDCIARAKARYLKAGILSEKELPAEPTLKDYLVGSKGTPGAIYLEWAKLHTWALKDPKNGLKLALSAVLCAPLNKEAWSALMKASSDLMIPAPVARRLAWYGSKLRRKGTRDGSG